MLNYIWVAMLVLSFVSAAATGRMPELSSAILSGAGDAVTLCIKLLGTLCLWGGVMNIAEKSGLTIVISRLLSPLLKRVFPKIGCNDPAMQSISMNVTANLLGLGNAATPLGIEAMKRLRDNNPLKDTASDEMICFVVLNSAALHIIPTTVALLRQEFGSAAPFDIMPASWIASCVALCVGLAAAKGFNRLSPASRKSKLNFKTRKGGLL